MIYVAEFFAGLMIIGGVLTLIEHTTALAADTPPWVWWLLGTGVAGAVHWRFYPAPWLWRTEVSIAFVAGPPLLLFAVVSTYYHFRNKHHAHR